MLRRLNVFRQHRRHKNDLHLHTQRLCSRFPKSQQPILRECGDEVLVWMVSHSKNLFFVHLKSQTTHQTLTDYQPEVLMSHQNIAYREGSFQFATAADVKAVKKAILTHRVDPLAARTHRQTNKFTTLSLPIGATADYLFV